MIQGLDIEDEGWDEFIDSLEPLLSLSWDSGAPGAGAGAEHIYEVEGRFFIHGASFCQHGPFAHLDAALREFHPIITETTVDVSSSSMSAAEIMARLTFFEELGDHTFTINDALYRYHAATRTCAPA